MDKLPSENNTTKDDNPPSPPSDISHISETQITPLDQSEIKTEPPIDISKIKTEPNLKNNLPCDIIVIHSDSEDSLLNVIPETPSSTENTIPPPNPKIAPETPPLEDQYDCQDDLGI